LILGFRDVRLTKVFDRYSILKILAGDVWFVNLFRSILPVVPTECDVLTVHCVSKKQDTKLLPITSPNVNRFSKFFHW